jgi:hypothetical protein
MVKRFPWILLLLAVLAILGTALQLLPPKVPERTCSSSIVITKGKGGAPLECLCEGGAFTTCFGPGP